MIKTEQELMEELVESIFSGNLDSDDSKEDTKDDDDTSADTDDKDTDSKDDDDADDNDTDSKDDDDDESDSKSDDGDDDEDDEKDSDDDDKPDFGGDKSDGNGSGPFTSKIRTLHKQYNDLLIDAFEKYAPECIEDALDDTDSSFGENLEDILDAALSSLKDKIMDDMGVEGSTDGEGLEGMMPPAAMGSFDPVAGEGNPMEISVEKM